MSEECRHLGLLTLKLNVYGRRGWPDRIVLYAGEIVFIELKRPGEKPTELQTWTHNMLRDKGFSVVVLSESAEIRKYLREWKNDCDRRSLEAIGGYSHHD